MTITNPSALVAAPEGRALPTDALPEIHNTLARHGATGPEAGDKLRHDLADQARLVFIGRHFAEPFLFIPFHDNGDSRDRQQ